MRNKNKSTYDVLSHNSINFNKGLTKILLFVKYCSRQLLAHVYAKVSYICEIIWCYKKTHNDAFPFAVMRRLEISF